MTTAKENVTCCRSIGDSEKFRIEDDLTCLVGKNEPGKTNVQKALFRLKPIGSEAFDKGCVPLDR